MIALLCALLAAHGSFASQPAPTGRNGATDSISVAGAVEHPRALTLADLKREPAITTAVSLRTARGVVTGSYTGVLLWTLLQHAVIRLAPGRNNDMMRHTVVVTGSDGYATVLSVAEIDPEFGGEQALVAYAKDGRALSNAGGFARLIFPADRSAGRAIKGIVSIVVR